MPAGFNLCSADDNWGQKNTSWCSIKYPKKVDAKKPFSINITLKGSQIKEKGKLMVALHGLNSKRRRIILPQTYCRQEVTPNQDAAYSVELKFPNIPNLVAVNIPIWISRDGKWVRKNAFATEVQVLNKNKAAVKAKKRVKKVRLDVVLPNDRQPGLYYNSGETTDFYFRKRGKGKVAGTTSLPVKVKEEEGNFSWQGNIPFDGEKSDAIKIPLPRIGYYHLTINFPDNSLLENYKSGIAVLPKAPAPSKTSFWGAMRAGKFAPNNAALARRLGLSWIRSPLWLMPSLKIIKEGEQPELEVDVTHYKNINQSYKKQGLFILGGFQMIPKVLSSQPNNNARSGHHDAGVKWCRVKPRDYRLWRAYVKEVVKGCKGTVDAWEVGNEANMPDGYWGGTWPEFYEWFEETAKAIRSVDPEAFIVGPSVTLAPETPAFLKGFFKSPAAKYVNAFSVHSLYNKPISFTTIKRILAENKMDHLPIWNTEPKQPLPLLNLEANNKINLHFLLRGLDRGGFYNQFKNLSNDDLSATLDGIVYATASRIIGSAPLIEMYELPIPDVQVAKFRGVDGEEILAVDAEKGPRGAFLNLTLEPGPKGITLTDRLGRSKPISGTTLRLPLDRVSFLNGAKKITKGKLELPETSLADGVDIPVKQAILSNGFKFKKDPARGTVATVWIKKDKFSGAQPTATFILDLEKAGTYEFFIASQWVPFRPTLSSHFSWEIDKQGKKMAEMDNMTTHWQKSTREHLRFGACKVNMDNIINATDYFTRLGIVRNLSAGKHQLRIRLELPRAHDNAYCAEILSISYRPIEDDIE